MPAYESQANLGRVLGGHADRITTLERAVTRNDARSFAPDDQTGITVASPNTALSYTFTTTDTTILELYCHGLGTTNGAGRYCYFAPKLDSADIFGTQLIRWGSSTTAWSADRAITLPGSNLGSPSGTGNTLRLSGFVVTLTSAGGFLDAGEHTLDFNFTASGSGANCSVTDICIAVRLS